MEHHAFDIKDMLGQESQPYISTFVCGTSYMPDTYVIYRAYRPSSTDFQYGLSSLGHLDCLLARLEYASHRLMLLKLHRPELAGPKPEPRHSRDLVSSPVSDE